MPMRMDMNLYQKLEMRLRLAPQIIQSIEILQLPTLELQQRIEQELQENPVLEQNEPALETVEPEEDTAPKDERTSNESEFDKMQELEDRIGEYSSQAPARPVRTERDPKLEAMQNTAARTISLQEFLGGQLSIIEIDPVSRVVAENIIYNLDDNGYLQYTLEEIVESMPPGTTVTEAERVLSIVQSLDPPGVGARDLKECLMLQLARGNGKYDLERILVGFHLEDMQMNRYPKIVKETGRTLQEVRDAADMICRLSPRPGAMFSSERPHYVLPDVEIQEMAEGQYEVMMCDDYLPRLRISRQYLDLLRSKTSTEEEKEYVKKKVQSARWLIDAVQQRRNTLRRIMVEIVKTQSEFFEKGIRFLKPLKMGAVAEAAGVHVSTVSRAISDKYAQTPRGLFDIKFFFAGSAQANDDGSGSSRESVQELVREVVDAEDKHSPLSDGGIVRTLKGRGIDVSRRTVTKYRQSMNIPPSRQRVKY